MDEIRVMQLWVAQGGFYIFITEVNHSENIARGVCFDILLGQSLWGGLSWELDTKLCSDIVKRNFGANLDRCVGKVEMFSDGEDNVSKDKYVTMSYFLEFQEMVRRRISQVKSDINGLHSDIDYIKIKVD